MDGGISQTANRFFIEWIERKSGPYSFSASALSASDEELFSSTPRFAQASRFFGSVARPR